MEMMTVLVGIAIGAHFTKVLKDSGKQSFTKEEIIKLHAEAVIKASEELNEQKEKSGQKEKDVEYPKPMSDIPSWLLRNRLLPLHN